MAIRNIRISTDEVLRKTCKPIKEITPNLLTLLDLAGSHGRGAA